MRTPVPTASDTGVVLNYRVGELEEKVDALGSGVGELTNSVNALNVTMASMTERFEIVKASGSHELVKTICTTLVSIVATIAGIYGVQKMQAPPDKPLPTVVHKTALDDKIDACRILPNGSPQQTACVNKAIELSLGVLP